MRWLLVSLVALVLVVSIAGAVVLVPPHLEIRDIAPPLPTEARLRALADLEGGPVDIRYIESSSQEMAGRTLGHSIFVVEWADGRLFMIDAGMDRQTSLEFGELMAMLQDAEAVQYGGTANDVLGEATARVEGVGFTHLHRDHVQGIEPFCEARGAGAKLYQTRWQADIHNLHTVDNAEIVERSCLEKGALGGDVILTTDAFPGLGIVALGGHTPGSTLFAVPIDGTLWLISGDISNVKANLLSNTDKGFVYSTFIVPEDTERTEALRLWLGDLDAKPDVEVVVSHDIAAAEASGMTAVGRSLAGTSASARSR